MVPGWTISRNSKMIRAKGLEGFLGRSSSDRQEDVTADVMCKFATVFYESPMTKVNYQAVMF